MDPEGGREPFVVDAESDDPCVVVFNGELLEHLELRRRLEREGRRFETGCDAETAAVALATDGAAALQSFRGMFAVAWYRPARRRIWLARDPFGVVPLLHAVDDRGRFVFSSEMRPMLEHLGDGAVVDPATVGAYLSTIRLTVGERTLVDGVRTVRPGHVVEVDLGEDSLRPTTKAWWRIDRTGPVLEGPEADEAVAAAVESSLEAHLQSDVEVCSLLSGGLDSAVLTSLAIDRRPDWRTFTAVGGDGTSDPDRDAARLLADAFGRASVEVPVLDRPESPLDRWRRMVGALGVPLGTPNEIAINALAEAVRDAGIKVAISGEGADEIFGGYEPVLRIVQAIAASSPTEEVAAASLIQSIAWIPPHRQSELLHPDWIEAIGPHEALVRETAASIADGGSPGDPRSYLRWLQRVNLSGLLGRLNHACMLASVEARPPFADRRVAEVASRVATPDLFQVDPDEAARTKTALRRAFADRLPSVIVERAKASFPVPFVPWANSMLEETAVREAVAPLLANPEAVLGPEPDPMIAWPLANLGAWSLATGLALRP